MILIGYFNSLMLFAVKLLSNALSTAKTIMIQKSRWLLAGVAVMLSEFIYYWIMKSVVSADGNMEMLLVSIAGGVGCAAACLMNEKLSRERTYVNVIMSDEIDAMRDLRGFLAEHHITNVASESYTLDWGRKTITVTAYPETKDESRLINEYIASSPCKFKFLVQPGNR